MNGTTNRNSEDPFGLGGLPLLEPDRDGWPEIRAALEARARSNRRWKRAGGWLAVAATLVLTVGIIGQRAGVEEPAVTGDLAQGTPATVEPRAASLSDEDALRELIAMSQALERRVRGMREGPGALPAESATYIAELEDMIARVDGELSLNPESMDLWGQRVNLLLDLEVIFQHRWEIEYGRMASR